MFRKNVMEAKLHHTDRVIVNASTGNTEVSDEARVSYPGILGDARTWFMDASVSGEACYKDHLGLLHSLAQLFEQGTPEDVQATEQALEKAGFLIGYEREGQRVTISHGSIIMSRTFDSH